MASLNKVFLMGNLTRDPELRYTPNGAAVASFSVAVNRVYKLPSGEKKEEVSFIRVVSWNKQAELCGEYLKKGSGVMVEGRLQSRSWDGPDGQKHNATEVIALNIQFLPRGGGAGAGARGPAAEEAAAPASSAREPLEDIQLDMPAEDASHGGDTQVPF